MESSGLELARSLLDKAGVLPGRCRNARIDARVNAAHGHGS
jgi:hypothetical protein